MARETGAEVLDLSDLTALTALPGDIATLTNLRRLFVGGRRADGSGAALSLFVYHHLHDIAALSGMAGLTSLGLLGTGVSDLNVLLHLPTFAEERARSLQFQGTPAADPDRDRRMYMLSRLDPRRCAIETVQYLKGTHPDFQGGAGGAGRRPLAERLAGAAPVGVVVEDGRLGVTNPGAPARVRPRELVQRVVALRGHVAALQDMAQGRQVPPWFAARLAAYAAGLATDEPTFILLEGPMAFLRGGVGDAYVTAALDGALVGGWRHLVAMHDDLRPHLMPPEEDDDLPALSPEATPEAGIAIADRAIEAAREAEGPGGTDKAVAEALGAIREILEVARADENRRPNQMRRGIAYLGGTLNALIGLGASGSAIAAWLATTQGQSFLAVLRPIYDAILRFFVA